MMTRLRDHARGTAGALGHFYTLGPRSMVAAPEDARRDSMLDNVRYILAIFVAAGGAVLFLAAISSLLTPA